MGKKQKFNIRNAEFIKSLDLNERTFWDYVYRFRRIALSIFEWVNLPKSMNSMYIEKCLYYYGQCAFLKDKNYGFINTKASDNEGLNLYGIPTSLHCYSYDYQTNRKVYMGFSNNSDNEECILVQNNIDRLPTCRKYGIICNAFK